MKKPLAFAIVIIFVATAPLLWWNNSQGSQYDQGKSLYDSKCQICHGAGGKGNGPAAASLSPRPTDFTKADFWQQKDVDKLISNTILNGHGPMPPFQMKAEEVKAVVHYMSSAFKPGS